MLSLTKKADYALVAMVYLGQLRQEEAGPASARQIAQKYDLPSSLVMNVLKTLASAKLVRSTRGASGGYELAADPQHTTLLEVITVVEGPLQLATCTDKIAGMVMVGVEQDIDADEDMEQGCSLESTCPIRSPIRKLHQRIANVLSEVTLQDLMDDQVTGVCACESPSQISTVNKGFVDVS